LLVCLMAVPVFAWEFSMTGAHHSEYRYLTQLGENGFFGRYDQINPAVGEAVNLYSGVHFLQYSGQDIIGGSEAATHAFWLDIDPELRLNKAIRIRGRYRVGNTTAPLGTYDTKQFHSQKGGVYNEMTYGGWSMLWGTAQTPWGTIVLGKRPFAFGTGLIFDGTTTLSTDSILFVAPYGPFRFLIAQQAARATGLATNRANKTGVEEWEHTAVMTYQCGPLEFGAFLQYVSAHGGPECNDTFQALGVTLDRKLFLGSQYLKYANGRFFFNAEVAQHLVSDNYSGTPAALAAFSTVQRNLGNVWGTPQYTEHVRWMVETGVLAGPLKLSLLYANVPGGNNRGDKSYQSGLVNTTVFAPYSLLMVRDYGSGLVAYSGSIYEGMLQDAAYIGARADYAIAANLNAWVAGGYAERINNSQGWGCVAPVAGRARFADRGIIDNSPAVALGIARVVPNKDLGWEINGGIDWKLMEGLRILQEVGYFQPGNWFKHAYIDAGVNPAAPAFGPADVTWDRNIDPILAYYLTANFEF